MNDIVVIGSTFIDCKGFVGEGYEPEGRNRGEINFVHGGVARNVAENLSHFGSLVTLVSSVDETAQSVEIIKRLKECHVNTEYIAKEKNGLGKWILLDDKNGSQIASLSSLADARIIEGIIAKYGDEIIKKAQCVVLETDISEFVTKTVTLIAKKYDKKLFVISASMAFSLKDAQYYSLSECFVCNHLEAQKLLGEDTYDLLPGEMLSILDKGIKKLNINSMIITMGENGAVYKNKRTGEAGYQPAIKTEAIDTSGAGDAFFSAIVYSLLIGDNLSDAVKKATKIASLTVQSIQNVSEDLDKKRNVMCFGE